jgi:hypothetical protein
MSLMRLLFIHIKLTRAGQILFVPVMAVPTEQTINSRKPLLNEYLEKLVANGIHLSFITCCIFLNRI